MVQTRVSQRLAAARALEAGKIGTYERDGSTSIDTTAQTIEQLKMKVSTLEALLGEAQSTDQAPREGA
jgi:hypothetical protein